MDPLRNLSFLIKDVSRLAAKNFERHASAVNLELTLPQCKVLIYLQRNQGISQVRLAGLTETDPMTLVRILDRMEGDGWLERKPDPADRRARRLHLKPAAFPVVKQIWAIADRARAEAFAGVRPADRERLLDLLQQIHGNLAALVPGAVEPARLDACAESTPEDAESPPARKTAGPALRQRGGASRSKA